MVQALKVLRAVAVRIIWPGAHILRRELIPLNYRRKVGHPAGYNEQRGLRAGFKVLQKLRYLNSQIDALHPLETGVGIFPLKMGCQFVLSFNQLDNPGIFLTVKT